MQNWCIYAVNMIDMPYFLAGGFVILIGVPVIWRLVRHTASSIEPAGNKTHDVTEQVLAQMDAHAGLSGKGTAWDGQHRVETLGREPGVG